MRVRSSTKPRKTGLSSSMKVLIVMPLRVMRSTSLKVSSAARWLMPPTGFEAVVGNAFTFQTKPGGNWDGVIHCRVLEVVANRRLVYAWKGGDARNTGYGAPLDTVVTWSLTPVEAGTRIRLVHAGFVLPRNESAYTVMSGGWKKVVRQLDEISGEE